jgi:hypothetical protein
MTMPTSIPSRRVRAATVLLFVGGISGSAVAQDERLTGTRVSPGGTTRVYVMAAFDSQCNTTGAAVIDIVTPPAQGTVSLRPNQSTTIMASLSGKCIGARVQGTGIYYVANAKAAGRDTFSIRARLGTGEVVDKSFQLRIED